jgi:prepilin-type N-terminal cleavage/methylation domain-containing protein
MKYLDNNEGFTLIEVLIVIIIIGIAISMSSLGYRVIFDARVDAYAEQFQSDLRGMRNDSLNSLDKDYKLVWAADGLSYVIKKKSDNTVVKTEELPGDLVIKIKTDSMSDYKTLSDYYASLDESYRTIAFDKSDGSLTSNGAGAYMFSAIDSDDIVIVTVYEVTGRVFSDD